MSGCFTVAAVGSFNQHQLQFAAANVKQGLRTTVTRITGRFRSFHDPTSIARLPSGVTGAQSMGIQLHVFD
jgi:hypothetical protein